MLGIFLLWSAAISLTALFSVSPQKAGYQLVFFVLSGAVFWGMSKVSIQFWKKISLVLYAGALGALLLTFVIGDQTKGSSRWFDLGFIKIQPSQVALPIFLLSVATVFSKRQYSIIKKYAVTAGMTFLYFTCIFLQPDLGTALVFLVGYLASMFMSGIDTKILYALGIAFVFFSIVAWNVALQDYQKKRVTSFISSFSSSDTEEFYQAHQATIAVGSGKMFGRGMKKGVQSSLRFLPEKDTDFIFASFTEETGFFGSITVVLFYAIFLIYAYLLSTKMKENSDKMYFLSFAMLFVLQACVNISMNIGILPVVGITLPMISYGGSALLSFTVGLGLMQSILHEQKKKNQECHIEIRQFV